MLLSKVNENYDLIYNYNYIYIVFLVTKIYISYVEFIFHIKFNYVNNNKCDLVFTFAFKMIPVIVSQWPFFFAHQSHDEDPLLVFVLPTSYLLLFLQFFPFVVGEEVQNAKAYFGFLLLE